jgi:hypothetical protein
VPTAALVHPRYIQKGILDKEWGVALDFQFKDKFGEA